MDADVKVSLHYNVEPGKVTLIHTDVDPSVEGRAGTSDGGGAESTVGAWEQARRVGSLVLGRALKRAVGHCHRPTLVTRTVICVESHQVQAGGDIDRGRLAGAPEFALDDLVALQAQELEPRII